VQKGITKSSSGKVEGRDRSCYSSAESEFINLIPRYLDLFPLHRAEFYEQSRYVTGMKNPWSHVKRFSDTGMISRHLDHGERFWIASKCREEHGNPVTTFLVLDLDANDGGREAAWERLCRIREVFGEELAPLVYTSPGGGYHAVWFFDRPVPLAALVDLQKPMSCGLLVDVLRVALDKIGHGVCEVYPQPKKCVRWPMGTDQHPVDLATGLPVAGVGLLEMLEAAERHRAAAPRLTLEHLRSLRPVPLPAFPVLRVAEQREDAVGSTVCGIGLEAIEAGRRAYRDGLTELGTRNGVTFQIARVMVLAPDALLELGFDPSADRAEQLLAWLESKHNGYSEDFAARPDDRDFWRAECERVIQDVEKWRGTVQSEPGMFLTEAEWDAVFALGAAFQGKPGMRYRVELVAACWLRMAKWSVVRGGGYPEEDGTFTAEIHWSWRREKPFCSKENAERRYREILQEAGLFRFERPSDWVRHRAALYSGFQLDLGGVQPNRHYSPTQINAVAQELGEDTTLLAYCVEVEARFPGKQLRSRYGRGGVEFIRKNLARLDATAVEGAIVSQLPPHGSYVNGLESQDSLAA
jgi:hypothetical protein